MKILVDMNHPRTATAYRFYCDSIAEILLEFKGKGYLKPSRMAERVDDVTCSTGWKTRMTVWFAAKPQNTAKQVLSLPMISNKELQ